MRYTHIHTHTQHSIIGWKCRWKRVKPRCAKMMLRIVFMELFMASAISRTWCHGSWAATYFFSLHSHPHIHSDSSYTFRCTCGHTATENENYITSTTAIHMRDKAAAATAALCLSFNRLSTTSFPKCTRAMETAKFPQTHTVTAKWYVK